MMLEKLETEQRNPDTLDIDRCSTLDLVKKINREDSTVSEAVAHCEDDISRLIDMASERLRKNGRIIYMGAGTSGRLGVLDAVECRPTFGVPDGVIIGLIAGGEKAMFKAQEGAEDSEQLGEDDLRNLNLTSMDTVIGLAASGRTPYVIGGLKYAKETGALTAAVSCVSDAVISRYADVKIEAVTGPECLTGSTRMKAGTAEKMICNMISTGCMIRYGKVYENLMIDVQPTNDKLVERAKRIIAEAVHCDSDIAGQLFVQSNLDVKVAVIMGLSGSDYIKAEEYLRRFNGDVHRAIVELKD